MEVVRSHKVAGKDYVNTENSQMESMHWFHFQLSPHITESSQIHCQTHQPVMSVIHYSWLSVCPGEIEPYKDHPSTYGHLTSLRNKPQQKQPWATFSTNTCLNC